MIRGQRAAVTPTGASRPAGGATGKPVGDSMFLRHVHNFRAVAMLVIVGGHAVEELDRTTDPPVTNFLFDLFDSGTVLFVFVAGFLFEHLSRNFRYRDYLHRKLRNVLIPYLVISIPAVLLTAFLVDNQAFPAAVRESPVVLQIGWMLGTGSGTFNYAMWFIPMITLLYLAAPLFMQLVRHPRLYLLALPLLAVSVIAHRPPESVTPAILLYFLPAYVIGMWASHQRERLEPLLRRGWWVLCALFVAAVVHRSLTSPWHGGEHVSGLFSGEFGLIDEMLLMKLLLCFAVLGLMLRFDGRIGNRLRFLGDVSFTIYFVHCYFLAVIRHGYPYFTGTDLPGTLVTWLVVAVVTLGVTAACAAVGRRVLGRHSRYLIGS